jgi:hypothetical protein
MIFLNSLFTTRKNINFKRAIWRNKKTSEVVYFNAYLTIPILANLNFIRISLYAPASRNFPPQGFSSIDTTTKPLFYIPIVFENGQEPAAEKS